MLGLHPKVQNPLLSGAITTIVVWIAKAFFHQDIPGEVASAATLLVMTLTGYQTKPSE